MKKLSKVWTLGLILVALSGIAVAAPCSSLGVINVLAIASCEVSTPSGDLIFSNFAVQLAGGVGPAVVELIAVSDEGTLNPALTFNPNMISGGTTDIHFSFQVTGPLITDVSLDGGASTGSINEIICLNQPNINNGACPVLQLGQMIWFQGDMLLSTAVNPGPQSSLWVWKDILIEQSGGHNSGFTQDFQVSAIPEPVTFSMVGLGLLGLGLVSRRKFVKK